MKLKMVLRLLALLMLPVSAGAGEVTCQCVWDDASHAGSGSCAVSWVEPAVCAFATPRYDHGEWKLRLRRIEAITGEALKATFWPHGISQAAARQLAQDDPARLVDSLFAMAFVTDSMLDGEFEREPFMVLFNGLRRDPGEIAEAFAGGEVVEYNGAMGYGVRKGCFQVRNRITSGAFSFMYRTDWAEFEKPYTCVTSD